MATPIIMPKQGQSVETCIITEWFKNKGDFIKKGDLLFSYETDKAAFEEEAAEEGILLEIFYEAGDEVAVLTNVAVIGKEGENIDQFILKDKTTKPLSKQEVKEEPSVIESKKTESVQISNIPSPEGKIKISPRARNMAKLHDVPIHSLNGSGTGGRIMAKDVELFTKTSGTSIKTDHFKDEYEIKKLSNIRKIIAENMLASLQNSAQLTHHISADARKLLYYRSKFKKSTNLRDITLNDIICYAVIKALKIKPEINSHFLGNSIKTFKKVHLGIAVDTERGLMVPTIKNANDLSINELSTQIKSLAESCRKGNIDPELLDSTSATFTISNLGAYGIEMFTPVINLPQSGILGVNTIIKRPGDLGDGVFGFIPYLGLSLTYDHRVLDGAPASAFLKEVKVQIENLNLEI